MRLLVLFTFFSIMTFSSCSDSGEANHLTTRSSLLGGYNLSSPYKSLNLPSELNEVSGIEYLENNRIACVQDEEASIFIYNLEKNTIEEKIRFGNTGDFEDIRKAGEGYYILRSDGAIFHYKNGHVNEYHPFQDNCNTEGLCYIPSENCLLISCKDKSRKVWRFDLATHTLSGKEEFIIDNEKIHATAMTYNPSNNELYILSTKELGIYTREGKHVQSTILDKNLFPQPEGISLNENGDLLISNEAKGKDATILEFKKQDTQPK